MGKPAAVPSDVSRVVTPEEELRELVATDLRQNRKERRMYEALLTDTRNELVRLLQEGRMAGFDVTKMARLAGVSRNKAHRLLRGATHD